MSQNQISTAGELPVLLIFFTPEPFNPRSKTDAMALIDSIHRHFADQINLLRIDPIQHPSVASSFHVAQSPTFILLRQGVELWRQTGLPHEDILIQIAHYL